MDEQINQTKPNWLVTRRMLRRVGTAYRSHLQGSERR